MYLKFPTKIYLLFCTISSLHFFISLCYFVEIFRNEIISLPQHIRKILEWSLSGLNMLWHFTKEGGTNLFLSFEGCYRVLLKLTVNHWAHLQAHNGDMSEATSKTTCYIFYLSFRLIWCRHSGLISWGLAFYSKIVC